MSAKDRDQLERLIRSGQRSARIINRARILLKTDEGWSASQVAAALDTSPRTVFRTKRRYAEEGLDGVLYDHPQANRYRKLDDRGEAHLIALACSDAPEGHDHWTLRLLADKVVELGLVVSLSHETVRLRLKKHPQALAEAAVVHLPDERGVCGGHGGRAGPVRRALRPPPAGGVLRRDLHPAAGRGVNSVARPARTTAAAGLRVSSRRHPQSVPGLRTPGWRHVAITERRTMQDFAHQMRWLVDVAYPDAPVVRVVLDNLNTHRMASLYETQRNAAGITIDWRFSTHDARAKLHRFYPCLSNVD